MSVVCSPLNLRECGRRNRRLWIIHSSHANIICSVAAAYFFFSEKLIVFFGSYPCCLVSISSQNSWQQMPLVMPLLSSCRYMHRNALFSVTLYREKTFRVQSSHRFLQRNGWCCDGSHAWLKVLPSGWLWDRAESEFHGAISRVGCGDTII